MPRTTYVNALFDLSINFENMLKDSRIAFINAMQSLKDHKIVEDFKFKKINEKFQNWETEIEKEIFRLIALQAPVSSDLRLMLGILKSTNDIKRIVNTSRRIVKVVRRYGGNESGVFASNEDAVTSAMEEMGEILLKMLDQIIDAFSSSDKLNNESAKELQKTLIENDDVVDSIFKNALKKLTKKILKEADTKKQAKQIADGLILARHMERIGDHICNIAERIIYIDTGENYHVY